MGHAYKRKKFVLLRFVSRKNKKGYLIRIAFSTCSFSGHPSLLLRVNTQTMKQTYNFARYGQSKSKKKMPVLFKERLYTGNGETIETRINKVIHNVLTKHSLVRNIQLCAYFRFLLRSWLCTNFRFLISRLISTFLYILFSIIILSYLLSTNIGKVRFRRSCYANLPNGNHLKINIHNPGFSTVSNVGQQMRNDFI